MINKHYILFILIFCGYVFNAAEPDSLSLETALRKAETPIQQVKAYLGLSNFYIHKDQTIALHYANLADSISKKSGYNEGMANANCALGEAHFLLQDYEEAKVFYTTANTIFIQLKNQIGIAESTSGLGKVACKTEKPDEALICFTKALTIYEKEKDKSSLPGLYINIGLLYDDARNLEQAIIYYNKALSLSRELNDETSMASAYSNLGSVYSLQDKYDLAIECLERSLKIKEKLGNKKGVAITLNNLGATYYSMQDTAKALVYFNKAYTIYLELNDTKNIYTSCYNIGVVYLEKNNFTTALDYLNKAYGLAQNSGSLLKRIYCLENLTIAEKGLGKTKEALEYSIKCVALKDTLYDTEQATITAEMQAKFATEKNQKENEILNLQVKSESFIKTIFIGVTCLLLLIAIYILWSLRQKQKINNALHEKNKIIEEQKLTVEHQKQVVEEQHKDITDSIKYAERIQQAILPPEQQWISLFSESFVLYKPKDILSGDFYWAEQKGNLLFVAAADCTGHGVPGALISIVNYNLLNKAVLEKDLNDPADILNYVNTQLIVALHQTYQDSSVKDGMDISLCVINTKTLELKYAGANNPMYIISHNQLEQLSPDKFPVGAFIEDKVQSFIAKQRQLQKGDSIYLFSDGFADQFGGPKGKKFKYKQLKDILLDIQPLPMHKQSTVLKDNLTTWQGNLEQVDDILIIGIRI